MSEVRFVFLRVNNYKITQLVPDGCLILKKERLFLLLIKKRYYFVQAKNVSFVKILKMDFIYPESK